MRNFTHGWPQSGYFFSKLRYVFAIFEKGQGRPPPPSIYAPWDILKTVQKTSVSLLMRLNDYYENDVENKK